MFASKSKFFAYYSILSILALSLYPLAQAQAKTINLVASSTDIVLIPGTVRNSLLSGSGNRCLYVDSTGNLLAKGFDCGSASGGDNMGDHSATQNIRLNSYWLSGDAGNEGIFVDSAGGVGVGTNSIAAGLRLLVSGNLSSSGTVSLTGPIYAGGGNRMITVDNSGVLGAAAIPVNTDIYWTGVSTNLVPATGRASLGLGALATLGAVSGGAAGTITDASITDADISASAAIASSKLQNGTYFITSAGTNGQVWTSDGVGAGAWVAPGASTDIYWTGTATNLVASTARTSLGLGALATLSTVANGQITDVAWSKLTGFPAACSAGQYVTAVGGTLTCATPAGGVSGSGTANYVSKWTAGSALGNSIIYDNGTYVGIGTSVPGTYKLNVAGTSNLGGNLTTTGSVSLTGPIYAGGGNRMITVDNSGVLGAAAIPVNTDIYWTGVSTNLVPATGRASLGLGALATLGAVSGGAAGTITDASITDADISASAAIASSKLQNGTYFITSAGTNGQVWTSDGVGAGAWVAPGASTDIYWTGTATNLVASTARTSLGLGALATLSTVANAQITDVAWSKLTGFPAACSAGQYVTAVGGTLTCATPAGGTDIYWTGTATNLVASTARTSLGLGALATLGAVSGGAAGTITDASITDADISASASISASKIQNGTYFINSAGTAGQVWTSDSVGAGVWAANSGVTGGGTAGLVPYWDAAKNLADTNIYYDHEMVGVGMAPAASLDVNGSLRSNSSVTFSMLGGSGTRAVIVDNTGSLATAAIPSTLPSGVTHQTLRHNGLGWTASSMLMNTGSTVTVNFTPQVICSANDRLIVGGRVHTTGIVLGTPLPDSCPATVNLDFNTGTGAVTFSGAATSYSFSSGVSVTGEVTASTGFTSGISAGLSGTIVVKGSTGVNCNLVFTGGILTSETCP